MDKKMSKLRGEHCINIFVSYELKERINQLAKKYDRTMADIVRTLIKVGIPVLEGLSEAEERLFLDYMKVIRKMRKVRGIGLEDAKGEVLKAADVLSVGRRDDESGDSSSRILRDSE